MAGIALGQSIFQMSWFVPDPLEAVSRWQATTSEGSSLMASRLERYPDQSFEVVSSGLFGTAQSCSLAIPTRERDGDPAMLLRQI